MTEVSLNPQARIEVRRVGEEQQPIVIVDDAFAEPDQLLALAASAEFRLPPTGAYYPGLVAHLPPSYLSVLAPALQPLMGQLFGVPMGAKTSRHGFFGLSTLPPETMSARQALPHTDSANLHSFASVHFLSTGFGGTAFYRHKATGFEVVTHTRSHDFNSQRAKEIATGLETAELLQTCYVEIASVEPVFNRLVFYRANQLHSAQLENTSNLSLDPRQGRLTANTFFNT